MLSEIFDGVKDSRQARKIRHKLIEIIVLVIVAVTAGCEAWYQIAHYCKKKEEFLKEKLGLKLENGVPSEETMERVFMQLDPVELENRFVLWTTQIAELMAGDSVNIDGKCLRGSKGNEAAIHMVSAWANREGLVLGQLKTDEKSNEITAVPELLKMLDLSGCVVTADAMNCQKDITEKITEREADYVLGLKENHEVFHKTVEDHFLYEVSAYETKYTEDMGHGRLEKREYYLETDLSLLRDVPEIEKWVKLNGVGMVKSVVEQGEKVSFEIRYFVTSLAHVEPFAKSVREHWGIENSLHWCLDVGFNEDKQRMRTDHSAENFAVIRHVSLNLLKRDDSKMSLKGKRHRCSYDDDFLIKVLFGAI